MGLVGRGRGFRGVELRLGSALGEEMGPGPGLNVGRGPVRVGQRMGGTHHSPFPLSPRTPELLWTGRGAGPGGSEPEAGREGGQRRGHCAQLPHHRADHAGGPGSWDQTTYYCLLDNLYGS